MKKLMMIAAFMVAAVSANAQFEPGTFSIQPKVGGTFSKVSNMPKLPIGYNVDLDKSVYTGALIGAEFEYQIAQPFSVAAGLNYSMQGCKWSDHKEDKAELKEPRLALGYINLPIVANVYLFKGFAIKAGVQFGFLTSANLKFELKDEKENLNYDRSFKDNCNKVDISIPMGISYQVPTIPIYIDGRYNLGLTNINKDGDVNYKNQVFQLTVGYKFAL